MTSNTVSFVLILSVALLTCLSCKKRIYNEPGPPTLPAETQTGARTFGCLVNGEIWLPKGKSMLPAITTSIQYNILNLKTNKGQEGIIISLPYLKDVGNYALAINTKNAQYIYGSTVYECINGQLTITRYDTTNKIISGRFYFTAKNNATEKTIEITDGRFDVTFTN